jgi:uncharacterized protein YbcI
VREKCAESEPRSPGLRYWGLAPRSVSLGGGILRSCGSPSFPLPSAGTQLTGKGENGTAVSAQAQLERPAGSSLQVALSNAIVGFMREYTGRGPTKARTTIRDNVVMVMLEQTLTKGEQVLVKKGRSEQVLALRHEYQEAMREESSAKVAELTGRNVIAFLSANHVDPDLAAEIYVLDGPPQSNPAYPNEADLPS